MVTASYPLLLAGVIGLSTPSAPAPETNSIRDISRAADARVVVAPCVTSSIACFHIGENRIKISRPLYRVLANRSCRSRGPRGAATFILAHEAGHAHGIYTESGANSYAYSHFRTVARRLGFKPSRLVIPPLGAIASVWSRYAARC